MMINIFLVHLLLACQAKLREFFGIISSLINLIFIELVLFFLDLEHQMGKHKSFRFPSFLSKIIICVWRFQNFKVIHGFNIIGNFFSDDIFLHKLRSKIVNTLRFLTSSSTWVRCLIFTEISWNLFHILALRDPLESVVAALSASALIRMSLVLEPSCPFFKLEWMNFLNLDSFLANVRVALLLNKHFYGLNFTLVFFIFIIEFWLGFPAPKSLACGADWI